jgi:hydroxyacylglutathione hydrolase
MQFRCFYLDPLAQASYLIADGDEAAVVDPRRDVDEYVAFARKNDLRIRYAIATHVHADFVAGLAELRAATGAEIVMGERFDGELSCRRLPDGGSLQVGDVAIRALPTPGHTPESVSYVVTPPAGEPVPERLLSGDTLFIGDVGRPDLAVARGYRPADMARTLWHSLHEVIAGLPDATEVWPAHGAGSACGAAIGGEASSTLAAQRIGNWAFAVGDPDEFAERLLRAQQPAPQYFAHAAALNRKGPRLLAELRRPRELDAAGIEAALAGGAALLDVRLFPEHAQGHFAQALNVGLQGGMFESWCGALIAPGRRIVLHAGDEARAEEAWVRLLRVGHEDVPGWTRALPAQPVRTPLLEPAVLAARLQAGPGSFQAVDVRRPGEYAAGHVPGAVHAELGPELGAAPALAALDRGRPTAVLCLTGYRSSAACALLRQAGFEDLHNVSGGMQIWTMSGMPLERGPATGSS